MENKKTLKLVIVGHVDHGKSTLIGRLLFDTNSLPVDKIEEMKKTSRNLQRETEYAFLLDHFQEERDQGITIDTTQIFFETPEKRYVIIDAPGHTEFVKNMITGASQAEAAILIVDSMEGIKEQTRRHAIIISLLGIKQVIVVFNKMDLIGYNQQSFESLKKETADFLKSLNINPSYSIPISALKGENIVSKSQDMGWYDGPTLLEGLNSFKERVSVDEKPFVFPVQDVYKINEKRIIAGRIEAGRIKKNMEITVLPDKKTTKVKSIEKFGKELESAAAGENIGIILEDALFIERGNLICQSEANLILTDNLAANIFWMSKEDLNEGQLVSFRCATQDVMAEIIEIKKRIDSSNLNIIEQDAKKLLNLEVGEVIIKVKRPVVVAKFSDIEELGRFVLAKNENICAGGIII